MNNDGNDRNWFTFFMALSLVCLGCIGALIMILNNQLWSKMDRMVSLFQERSRDVGLCIERMSDKLAEQQGQIQAIKTRLDMERPPERGKNK
jgi:hypothetical protein